jgi:hypothetical protein
MRLNYAHSIYHVASVQSEQITLINRDFTVENEHNGLCTTYRKKGANAILLFNKTEQPIYIDWLTSFVQHLGPYSQFLRRNTQTVRAEDSTIMAQANT